MPLNPGAANRAAVAVNRVLTLGDSFTAAAKATSTTVATMKRWLANNSVSISNQNGRWVINRSPAQKIPEFLELIWNGDSATSAARTVNSTVNTMSNQMLPDDSGVQRPIIVKVGNNWTPNFIGVRDYSMTLHGSLIGLNDAVQGRGQQAGPDAQQDEADTEYADIWWQVDFNNFSSTLGLGEVGQFWKNDIVSYLRQYLETPNMSNTTLANRFLGNADVVSHANSNDRIAANGSMSVSRLEQFLERYDLRMSPDVTVGVEPASGLVSPITWYWVGDFADDGSDRIASGLWQVMFLTNAERQEYPITINFEYDLLDEIE